MNINEVTYIEIEALDDLALSKLLLSLLRNESKHYQFDGIRDIIVPLKINVADAGDDGKVDCDATNGSPYVHYNQSIFQCKATDLGPQAVYNEFFSKNIQPAPAVPASKGKKAKPAVFSELILKDKIKEVLDAGGQYVFFIGHSYNTTLRDSRLAKAKQALSDYNADHGTNYQPAQVRIIEANGIANWTMEYIEALTFVQGANGINRPLGLKTMEELADFPFFNEIKFHSNPRLDTKIGQIQQTITNDKSSLRIIGHSGLGKTRLVYEALKGSGIIKQAVYFDVYNDADDIVYFVRTYGKRLEGIIIVDNCDYYTHKLLKDEINRTGSKFKLITIDYNVAEEVDKSKTSIENYIFLNNSEFKDVVKNILTDQFDQRLDSSHIEQIAEYSEGYPGMAVLFAQARLDGVDNLTEQLGDEVIQRLAFGREWEKKDESKFEILKACSVFTSFGRPAPKAVELLTEEEKKLFAAQRDLIILRMCEPVKTTRQFMESTDYFEERRVMERRGNYLSVKPTPLAVKLAMYWWKYFDHTKLTSLFPDLESLHMALPFVNRLSELDQLREAKNIVNDLWGPKSPFGTAEVLNTALGSRLFRSVATVNPAAAMATLENAFGNMSIEQLKKEIGPGRREMIWTLEALAFRKDYFEPAAKLMFRFAAAENENISNNATGQLLQLFHIVLAGTEADLVQRLKVIDEQLDNTEPAIRHLAITAMLRGLKGDTFHRDIGAEKQGSSAPLIDFTPTWPQSAAYWSEVINRLLKIARNNKDERPAIKAAIARAIRNLFYNNLSKFVSNAIQEILKFDNSYWESAINELNAALQYEAVNDEERQTIAELLQLLQPQTLADQVKYFVSFPVWKRDHEPDAPYVDYTAIEAANFAERLVADKIELLPILPDLLNGEQRKGYAFGRKLGELLQDPGLARAMFAALKTIDARHQNPVVLAAYVSALPKVDRAKLIDELITDDQLQSYAVYITSLQEPDFAEVNKLFSLLDIGKIETAQFFQFNYGRGLEALSPEQVLEVLERLAQYPEGQMVALELAHKYADKKNTIRSELFKTFLRQLIIDNNLLSKRNVSQAQYTWYDLTETLLKDGHDLPLMEAITKQILETAENDRISSIDNYLKRTAQHIISTEFDMFWSIIGPAILNNATYFTFKYFLGSNNGEYGHSGLLAYADADKLVKWCKENIPVAPKRIAYMMPVTVPGDRTAWHPLATKMINEFGDLPGFMNEVGSNIHSFGSVGSQVPYLQEQLTLILKLTDHPSATVREWVKAEAEHLSHRIERTKLDDQSEFLIY